MLDTSTWKPHKIGKIFNVVKGKRLTSEDQEVGDNVFIGATEDNNGITAYIGQNPLFPGNVISVAYNGSVGEAFYQPEPFWASDDVNVLLPEEFELNESIALFICAVLRHEKQMWGYARKWNLKQMNDTTILLPTTPDGLVDTGFMETYMATLDGNVEDIPDYFLEEGFNKACWYLDHVDSEIFEQQYAASFQTGTTNLNNREWREFSLDQLFEITPGKYHAASEYFDGNTPYISSAATDNGVKEFISLPGEFPGNSITTGKIHCDAFFQEEDFCATADANVLVPRTDETNKYGTDKMNKYSALFICSIINFSEHSKWDYGRQCRMGNSKKIIIMLPVDANGDPDWQFMEDYIKERKFSGNI